MPSRAFVIGEGADKKFWDITWDGPIVEITSGKWGTNGRAREETFASPSERDAFVAAEIKKIVKKGYREASEVAPAATVSSESTAREVQALLDRIRARVRPAWTPVFEPGDAGIGIVRGPMHLDRDEPWPRCPVCKEPLTGLFELDLANVPATELRRDALVQLFWCEAWETAPAREVCTVNGGWLARFHRRGPRRESGSSTSPMRIVDWTVRDEAPTDAGDDLAARLEAASQELVDDLVRTAGGVVEDSGDEYRAIVKALGLAAANRHKLAGFPTFVQEYPRTFARQIFQIECNAPFDVNFGDVGAGHLLETARGSLDFFWACH